MYNTIWRWRSADISWVRMITTLLTHDMNWNISRSTVKIGIAHSLPTHYYIITLTTETHWGLHIDSIPLWLGFWKVRLRVLRCHQCEYTIYTCRIFATSMNWQEFREESTLWITIEGLSTPELAETQLQVSILRSYSNFHLKFLFVRGSRLSLYLATSRVTPLILPSFYQWPSNASIFARNTTISPFDISISGAKVVNAIDNYLETWSLRGANWKRASKQNWQVSDEEEG